MFRLQHHGFSGLFDDTPLKCDRDPLTSVEVRTHQARLLGLGRNPEPHFESLTREGAANFATIDIRDKLQELTIAG